MGVPAVFLQRSKTIPLRVEPGYESERAPSTRSAPQIGTGESLMRAHQLSVGDPKPADAVNIQNAQAGSPANAGHRLGEKLWSYPQTRLVSVLGFIWVSFCLLLEIEAFLDPNGIIGACLLASVATFSLGFAPCLAISWLVAEFGKDGAVIVLIKAVPMAICIGLCIVIYLLGQDLTMATVVLVFTFVICVSNAPKALEHRLERSNAGLVRTMRSWFE